MAKVKAPLFSVAAKGKLSENLVFSLRSSGQQVRFQKKQKDVITEARTNQRVVYLEALNAWKVLSGAEKLQWKEQAKNFDFSGYNYFMQLYIDSVLFCGPKAYYGISVYGVSNYGNV